MGAFYADAFVFTSIEMKVFLCISLSFMLFLSLSLKQRKKQRKFKPGLMRSAIRACLPLPSYNSALFTFILLRDTAYL